MAELSYEGIQRKSDGLGRRRDRAYERHLTGQEISHAAERLKDFAKKSGRNRVATYNSPLIQEGDWRITAAPAA